MTLGQVLANEVGAAVVTVAVHASDPLTGLGAASILDADARLRLLGGGESASAEVIVVVEDSVDDGTFALLREIRDASRLDHPPRCVIVTDHFRSEVLMTAIECGMSALLPRRTMTGEDLAQAVVAVSRGVAQLPPRLQGDLLERLDRMRRDVLEPHGLTLLGLSVREREVLRLLADGHGTEEIAIRLTYSESTVKNVLHGLMRRYHFTTRAHAVAFAVRAGVI
ncbi:helix-turn-helix transcriptional regulator [Amycolatopsis sp. CA-230715]|uniref:helix-turn-helix transcriptional regulator n=1 Tax=Amycolatopsis sp. CA-230715 TaxID=2745196 RepID=UPI001C015CEF|nr:response regulator transcription factor [Amycolatopsis sp. CA-230715]QWF82994.1 Transcriptional regulatory protein LiaR [Amycolatopsis sp. CA-230715]